MHIQHCLSLALLQVPLGLDFLTFLAATVLVIPTFKSAKISPVLGFLFSGLLLGQLGCGSSAPAHATKQPAFRAGEPWQ